MTPPLNPELRARVRAQAENRPGVYRMLGPGGELLYVGKSVRVRSRVLSYFRAEPGQKPAEIIREATDVEWEYIPDEFGALVREMRLIQEHRPRYNVQHKRKRAFAFVKITREPAPRVLPVTRVGQDGAEYFGPFPRVGHVARTIRDLSHVLGLRDCPSATPMHFADQLDLFGEAAAFERVPGCIRAELGSCPAPCAGGITAGDYLKRVEEARTFVQGLSWRPLTLLHEAMVRAARRLDFEYAAAQRDRMDRLRRFQEDLAAYRGEVEGLRFVYPVDGHNGARRFYLIRSGRIVDQFPAPRSPRTEARCGERVHAAFSGPTTGAAGLTAHEAAEILLVSRWFRLNPAERERTVPPARWHEALRAAGSRPRSVRREATASGASSPSSGRPAGRPATAAPLPGGRG
ncbi:MAG: nuclease [Gemmatimonadota bacterium]